MKLGFVYAGQGSQKVGQGKDFYETFDEYKSTLDLANEVVKNTTDIDLKEVSFEGPIESLSKTRNTQPAMVAFAVGVTKLLKKEGIAPEYVLGLSLGEYSALYSAGVFDEKNIIDLVSKRGKFMEEAASGLEVKMTAVLGSEREKVLDCCRKASAEMKNGEIVQAANFNCPGQIVISGNAKAVDRAEELLKEAGTKRLIPLNVSGPFHTALMSEAGTRLRAELDNVDEGPMETRVVFNCLGHEKGDSEKVGDLLEKQVQSSVYLEDSIRYMAEKGVDTIVEIGPGNAISKFVKKTAPDIKVMSIDSVEDFENVVKELKQWA